MSIIKYEPQVLQQTDTGITSTCSRRQGHGQVQTRLSFQFLLIFHTIIVTHIFTLVKYLGTTDNSLLMSYEL